MRRPQNLCEDGLLSWIINNELESEPADLEKECWIPKINRRIGKDGRALFWWKGKMHLMYRVTWECWNYREFPEGAVARHLCGDAKCINPLHIAPGSARENELDKTNVKIVKSTLIPTPSGLTEEEKVTFWLENHTRYEKGCLLFTGSTGSEGYGRRNVLVNGKKVKVAVHRWVHSVLSGKNYWDSEWVARHTCANKGCINPDHIISGTRGENAYDTMGYSRSYKLREEQAKEIISALILEESKWKWGDRRKFEKAWAEKFGVLPTTVENIVRRKTWRNLWEALAPE